MLFRSNGEFKEVIVKYNHNQSFSTVQSTYLTTSNFLYRHSILSRRCLELAHPRWNCLRTLPNLLWMTSFIVKTVRRQERQVLFDIPRLTHE